jgi:hypothetical protein
MNVLTRDQLPAGNFSHSSIGDFTDDEERVVRAGEIAIHDNGHFVTEWLPKEH